MEDDKEKEITDGEKSQEEKAVGAQTVKTTKNSKPTSFKSTILTKSKFSETQQVGDGLTIEKLMLVAKTLGASVDDAVNSINLQAESFKKALVDFKTVTGKKFRKDLNPLTLDDTAFEMRNSIIKMMEDGKRLEKNAINIEIEYDAVIEVLFFLTNVKSNFRKTERIRDCDEGILKEKVANLKEKLDKKVYKRAMARHFLVDLQYKVIDNWKRFRNSKSSNVVLIASGVGLVAIITLIILFSTGVIKTNKNELNKTTEQNIIGELENPNTEKASSEEKTKKTNYSYKVPSMNSIPRKEPTLSSGKMPSEVGVKVESKRKPAAPRKARQIKGKTGARRAASRKSQKTPKSQKSQKTQKVAATRSSNV